MCVPVRYNFPNLGIGWNAIILILSSALIFITGSTEESTSKNILLKKEYSGNYFETELLEMVLCIICYRC